MPGSLRPAYEPLPSVDNPGRPQPMRSSGLSMGSPRLATATVRSWTATCGCREARTPAPATASFGLPTDWATTKPGKSAAESRPIGGMSEPSARLAA